MKGLLPKLLFLQLFVSCLSVASLYGLIDWQMTSKMDRASESYGAVIAASLAKSVEASLISRDLTSAQAALDEVMKLPDVDWAFITGPDQKVLAHTFVPEFPAFDNQNIFRLERGRLSVGLAGQNDRQSAYSARVLNGIVGAVLSASAGSRW